MRLQYEGVDTVALIIHRDGKILVELRRATERTDPSKVVIPGGHVDVGETFKEACRRELKKELGLECDHLRFVTVLPHRTEIEDQMIHYYSCEGWRGEPRCLEAAKIFWIDLYDLDALDFDIDRRAVREYSEIMKKI